MGDFFRQRGGARIRDHGRMMIGGVKTVNVKDALHCITPRLKKSRALSSPA